MDQKDILQKINVIAAHILHQPDLQLTPEQYTMDIEGWDSLAHINIINEVEKVFDIKFKLTEFYKIETMESFCKLIEEKKK